jgi:hypothetical protein
MIVLARSASGRRQTERAQRDQACSATIRRHRAREHHDAAPRGKRVKRRERMDNPAPRVGLSATP